LDLPVLYLVYAIPRWQLSRENGTSRRIDSLKRCFENTHHIVDVNLLEDSVSRIDKLIIFLFIAFGLNNFRYLILSRRLPEFPEHSTVLLTGIYSAFLGAFIRHVNLSIDLVDSLSLSDVRGIQSMWRFRPAYHFVQFPVSFLLERLLLSRRCVKSIFVTTQAERDWLRQIHSHHSLLRVLPNTIPVTTFNHLPELNNDYDHLPNVFSLAFIGSLDWWVNRRMLVVALNLLRKFLNMQNIVQCLNLNIYGDNPLDSFENIRVHPNLTLTPKGFFDSPREVYSDNHAAFLPNSIGRGFQNKLFTCLSLGLPTIAHVSMNPLGLNQLYSNQDFSPNPAIFCQTDSDYMSALSHVLLMDSLQRQDLKLACHQFLLSWQRYTQVRYHIAQMNS